MKVFRSASILLLTATALLAVGMLLPLWSKNGIAVTVWEGPYLTIGRWVLLACTVAPLVFLAIKSLQKPWILAIMAATAFIQSLLIFWKGYKLQAVAPGAYVLLLGGLLLGIAAYGYARANR